MPPIRIVINLSVIGEPTLPGSLRGGRLTVLVSGRGSEPRAGS
jgi:hypothetical protein